jgi:hypothetical protein
MVAASLAETPALYTYGNQLIYVCEKHSGIAEQLQRVMLGQHDRVFRMAALGRAPVEFVEIGAHNFCGRFLSTKQTVRCVSACDFCRELREIVKYLQ